jgi:hypothetical protein
MISTIPTGFRTLCFEKRKEKKEVRPGKLLNISIKRLAVLVLTYYI